MAPDLYANFAVLSANPDPNISVFKKASHLRFHSFSEESAPEKGIKKRVVQSD